MNRTIGADNEKILGLPLQGRSGSMNGRGIHLSTSHALRVVSDNSGRSSRTNSPQQPSWSDEEITL